MPPAAAIIGAGVLGAGASIFGARQQQKAIDKATSNEEAWRNRMLDLMEPLMGISREEAQFKLDQMKEQIPFLFDRFKDISGEALGRLRGAPESAREAFQLASRRGTTDIMSSLAPFGLTDSKVAGTAVGNLQEGLSAQEAQSLISQKQFGTSGMLSLLGLNPPTPTGTGAGNQAINILGQAGGANTNISQLLTGGGAVQSGLFGSLGQNIAQMPWLWNFMNTGGGGTGAASLAGSFGGSQTTGGFLN